MSSGLILVKVDPNTGFHLDVEDYLFGVLQLASELSRFSVSAVIAGNNMLPLKVFLYCHFYEFCSFSQKSIYWLAVSIICL